MSRGTLLSINGSMAFIQSLMVEIGVPSFEVYVLCQHKLVSDLGEGKCQDILLNQNPYYNRYLGRSAL